jgi:hypothetical protein
MSSVPSEVGVFFRKANKVSEGWYWTDALTSEKRKTAITGPFETKEKAVRNAVQRLAARRARIDEPAISRQSSVSSPEAITRRPSVSRSRRPGKRLDFWTRVRAECSNLPTIRSGPKVGRYGAERSE